MAGQALGYNRNEAVQFASDLSVLTGGNNYEVNAWYRDVGADNDRSNDFMTGIELVTYNKSGQKLGTQSLYEWEPGGNGTDYSGLANYGNSSQFVNNAANVSLIAGGITGIVNEAFKTAEQGVKSIALTPAAIQAEKFAQSSLKFLKGVGYFGAAFSTLNSLDYIRRNGLNAESLTRFGVNVTITVIGLTGGGVLPAIILGGIEAEGGFNWLYDYAGGRK